jgi:hypothetical protein
MGIREDNLANQGTKIAAVAASATPFAEPAKSLRVYVPTGTATPTVTVIAYGDETNTPIALTYPEGLSYEQLVVKAVTAIAAGVVVHRLFD